MDTTDENRFRFATPGETTELFVGNSGTTVRFLSAALAMVGGDYRLSGTSRMHERPIGDLVKALKQLGADVSAESANQCPPVRIQSEQSGGGPVTVRGDVSSQYLSGLMMAAPLASGTVVINVEGELILSLIHI